MDIGVYIEIGGINTLTVLQGVTDHSKPSGWGRMSWYFRSSSSVSGASLHSTVPYSVEPLRAVRSDDLIWVAVHDAY